MPESTNKFTQGKAGRSGRVHSDSRSSAAATEPKKSLHLRVSGFRRRVVAPKSENRPKDDKIEGEVPGKAEVLARVPEAAAADVEAARLGDNGDNDEEHH